MLAKYLRVCIVAAAWFGLPISEPLLFGQTLTEKLIQESPASLAVDARKGGDLVRGAILFHQGNINCAKCHRSTSGSDRIGPDLGRTPAETTDASIVESILQPSKTIKSGFESLAVVTVQGQVITGMVVVQDEQKIVLRSGAKIDQVVTIPKSDIEQSKPSLLSSMPDGLVNELKNRQQFLDLLRYVLDIKERGPQLDVSPKNDLPKRDLNDELKGWALINERNCLRCHAPNATVPAALATRGAPDLRWSAKWLNPNYLAKFIAEPQQTKPGTTMPQMLREHHNGSLNASIKETAEAIVHYLSSVNDNQFEEPLQVDHDAQRRGHELFQTIGCAACHAPRNESAIEQPLEDSIPLGTLVGKYDTKALTAFLEDPHAVRPSGAMPNMVLTHREATDLSSFLLQRAETRAQNDLPSKWKTDSKLAEKGKRLFSEVGCTKCHLGFDDSTAPTAPFLVPPLAELNFTRGCLSETAGNWPVFRLSKQEIGFIQSAVNTTAKDRLGTSLSKEQQIDITLVSYNCTACHRRGFGGVSDQRNPHFQTTNLNLGEQGRIPPTLAGVGAKLNPKWMRDVLVNHRSIRPYMKTRMPQFGEQNIGHLVELFQAVDHLEITDFPDTGDPEQTRKKGHTLVGNQGFNCVACHTYQFKLSDTMPAVDLTEMSERLKKDWFYQYMLAPQKFSPNTVMPSYWTNGKSIRPDIPGDPESQVQEIWSYLLDGRQADAPQGVVREPLEIVVQEEARMLRRSYPEIGKRGIGVGYRGGVNIAFDAEQLRLASIWKGKFVDPAGVWFGQGHGMVRSMGPTLMLAKGPELDDRLEPWRVNDGRPPQHHFKGYVLDEARRPTFHYSFASIDIDDFCAEFLDDETGKVQLRRRLKMTANQAHQGLRFRLAQSNELQSNTLRKFTIGKRLEIRIVSDLPAEIVSDSESSTLFVPLDFKDGQVHELQLEYRWD